MIEVAILTFNAFQENTYILYNEKKEAIIFDPGNSNATENEALDGFIKAKGLNLNRLILTHAHIDHILGNKHVFETYGLLPEIHEGELEMLAAGPQVAQMYAIDYSPSPKPEKFIAEGDEIVLGDDRLKVLFTPGHSPASISFYCEKQGFIIAGDVLFKGSVGRTDLPGGDYDTLIEAIKSQFLVLNNDVIVYPGHGPSTDIGTERLSNPFLQ